MVTGKGLLEAVKAVVAAPFKALLWSWFFLMRLVLYAGLAIAAFGAIVLGHGLWHMSHPLDNPKFKGLTYWQLQTWRTMSFDRRAAAYNRAYPKAKHPANGDSCARIAAALDFAFYPRIAAAKLPVLFHQGPVAFFQATDDAWEDLPVLGYAPDGHISTDYCTFDRIPTPKQFEQYKQEYRAWKAQQEEALQATH